MNPSAAETMDMLDRWTPQQVKEHFDDILHERDARYAAQRSEEAKATEVAERERDRAAKALRDALEDRIEEGDKRLHDHITQQVATIRDSLIAADKLESARVASAEAEIQAVRKELILIHSAQKDAVDKAEKAYEKRFEAVNAFREQLAEQTASFLPREVADAMFAELRKSIEINTQRINEGVGADKAHVRFQDRQSVTAGQVIATVSVVVAVLGIVAAILVGSFT
jgi:hypothetical protein